MHYKRYLREYVANRPRGMTRSQARDAAVVEVAETIALKSLLASAEMDAYNEARKGAGL